MNEQKEREKFETTEELNDFEREWYHYKGECISFYQVAKIFYLQGRKDEKQVWLERAKEGEEESNKVKSNINEAITLLAAPDMKWDQAMRILFKIVGREYPF